ncbi:MAG TPA: acyl carrier protein [Gemmatimonadaceae bacterium]|nr:acyl carrier protein [Gemmatimonadaceae bacterium]
MPTRLSSVVANALRVDPAVLNDTLEFNSIPEWDSVNHVALILSLEETYGLTISDDQIVTLTRYGAIREFIEAHTAPVRALVS